VHLLLPAAQSASCRLPDQVPAAQQTMQCQPFNSQAGRQSRLASLRLVILVHLLAGWLFLYTGWQIKKPQHVHVQLILLLLLM
jgi:hypothetical protein